MKKLYYLIILTVILGLVLTGCTFLSNIGQTPTSGQSGVAYLTKGIETNPDVFTLYAGQHIDVGTVSVWDDCENLYVKYETTGDWVMTETHLHVANKWQLIPHTKKGNPIPGQFDYNGEHAYETVVLYEIPLDLEPEIKLCIAAHAKVVRPIDGCYEEVWQIGDVEVDDGFGQLTNYCDEFNYAGFYEEPPGLLYPPFTDPFVVDDTSTNEFPWLSLGSYATDFNVRWLGELPFGGKLTVSWSPGQTSAKETKIIMSMDDGVAFTFVEYGSTDPAGWLGYPLEQSGLELDPIGNGAHEIRFQHTTGDGAIWDWVRLEKPCEQEETAWADGERFTNRGNWATYFFYDFTSIPTISSDDLAGPFTAGEFGYFTVTTVNPACGSLYEHVLFNYTIEGIAPSNIVSFKYYDEGTTTWYNAPVIQDGTNVIGFFGPPTGFLMGVSYDESTLFEIKIDTAGTYPVEITLNLLNPPDPPLELASFNQDVVVESP